MLLSYELNKIIYALFSMQRNKMEYLTTAETAERWNISRRRVTVYYDEGRIYRVVRKGAIWLIPANV